MATSNYEAMRDIRRRLEFHGQNVYGSPDPDNNSPLYSRLALQASKDEAVRSLLIDSAQPVSIANLFFGAVHYLLLDGAEHPLKKFYPSLTSSPLPPDSAYPEFRDFCIRFSQAIRHLIKTRSVQTNEVGRCTGLLPAFMKVYQKAGCKPLYLIEVGASAGLLLLWDRYSYDYGEGRTIGVSEVLLSCSSLGTNPPMETTFPPISGRIGIDLYPINVADREATLWLRALIWTEHLRRAAALEKALDIAKSNPPKIVAGNAVQLLPQLLPLKDEGVTVCIYHSYVFNQRPVEEKQIFFNLVSQLSQQRELFRVSLEWYAGHKYPELELCHYHNGLEDHTKLAECESHGRWINWGVFDQ